MRLCLCLFCALLTVGCRRYADFRLPGAGVPETGHYAWTARPGAVIGRGADVDLLNPSVTRWRGGLLMLASFYDGHTWHTREARSSDGLSWEQGERVLSPDPATWEGSYIAANGAVIAFHGALLHFYQAGTLPRLGLARSSDGIHWQRQTGPVVDLGPRGAWDERAVADPYVIEVDGQLYLYYLGEDRARRQRLGVAVSTDGVKWTKLRSNPVLELGPAGAFDENGLGEPAVWRAHGSWWMLYTGRARNEVRRLGLARSQDGVTWTRTGDVFAGAEPWDAKVLCDPTVLVEPERVRVWFGGGDVAHPAENVHGQIGYAELLWRAAQ